MEPRTYRQLLSDNESLMAQLRSLRERLDEVEETIAAVRAGRIDAVVQRCDEDKRSRGRDRTGRATHQHERHRGSQTRGHRDGRRFARDRTTINDGGGRDQAKPTHCRRW